MNIEFKKLDYIEFYKGTGDIYCLVDAPHAKPPQADLFTGLLVNGIVRNTGCSGIISRISRTAADLNRKKDGQNNEAIQQYREVIFEILQHLAIFEPKQHRIIQPFLHLTIHGMKDEHYGPYAIEIGTHSGRSCSRKMKKWLQNTITAKAKELIPQLKLRFDHYFDGDESIVYHRHGDQLEYIGYGNHFHTFQIELSRTLREEHKSEIVELFSYIILAFQSEIVDAQHK